jgi:hypothetical protein
MKRSSRGALASSVPDDCVLLPRHKQQELVAILKACRDLIPLVQHIVMSVTEIAIHPELAKARTATITDATAAIERTKVISAQLEALSVYVAQLERLTMNPPKGSVM